MRPLDLTADSVRAARSAARVTCAHHGLDGDRADAVVLVTAELIGNAVRHGAPPVAYAVEVEESEVLVVVQDGSDQPPGDVSSPPSTGESGRGLFIVSQLARDWGWRSCLGGKQVWARL